MCECTYALPPDEHYKVCVCAHARARALARVRLRVCVCLHLRLRVCARATHARARAHTVSYDVEISTSQDQVSRHHMMWRYDVETLYPDIYGIQCLYCRSLVQNIISFIGLFCKRDL